MTCLEKVWVLLRYHEKLEMFRWRRYTPYHFLYPIFSVKERKRVEIALTTFSSQINLRIFLGGDVEFYLMPFF